MHDTALDIGKKFFDVYWADQHKKILDVGSRNVNGTLRTFSPPESEYVGIDVEAGADVDIVLDDPNSFPFDDASFDLVISTSTFEHNQMFWLSFAEMGRVLRPGGYIYINAPSNGDYHPYPHDNWRFYPDAGLALEAWAAKLGLPLQLVESFTAARKDDIWNDSVMVFTTANDHRPQGEECLADYFPNAYNVRRPFGEAIGNFSAKSEDCLLLSHAGAELRRRTIQIAKHEAQLRNLEARLQASTAQAQSYKKKLERILASKSWRFIATCRAASTQLHRLRRRVLRRLGVRTTSRPPA